MAIDLSAVSDLDFYAELKKREKEKRRQEFINKAKSAITKVKAYIADIEGSSSPGEVKIPLIRI